MAILLTIIGSIVVVIFGVISEKARRREEALIQAEEDAIKVEAYEHNIPVKHKKNGRIAGLNSLLTRIDKAKAKLEMQQTLIDNPTAYLTIPEANMYYRAMALGLKVSLKTDGHISGYEALITRVNNKERSERQRLQKLKDEADKIANSNNIDLM